MTLLAVQNLSKWFSVHQLNRHIPVLEEISFQISPGEFLLIQGGNGVGKSTLLRCLYRTYLPSSGSALYSSRMGEIDLATAADLDMAELRRLEIGFVTQFLRFRPRVTAQELVAEPLFEQGAHFEAAQEEAAELLSRLGCKKELLSAFPNSFSGGEQQKVNLAKALILPRRLLLLDEPTASLDRQTRLALVGKLQELKAKGTAMIGVFHHPEDVEGLIDHAIELQPPASEPKPIHEEREEAGQCG